MIPAPGSGDKVASARCPFGECQPFPDSRGDASCLCDCLGIGPYLAALPERNPVGSAREGRCA